ncbi:Fe-only nitrogenase accessory AnfO family protein [Pantoea sp. B65]|uniref:Fe-only nitrogenase accessory AnfO family protein n=1 Tax=Pantoea sp. B65 TaxID=2813359 RepID=UPI0039B5DFA0
MEIAVFINLQGEIATLFETGNLMLFARRERRWQVVKTLPVQLAPQPGLAEIRQQTWRLRSAIPDCRHLLVNRMQGAQIAWLDGLGVQIWQAQGNLQALPYWLDAIRQQAADRPADPLASFSAKFMTAGAQPGEFEIDLIAALNSDRALTSKQLLLPVLTGRAFHQLNVVCDHLPKWFARELPALQLQVRSEINARGQLCAVVSPLAPLAAS